MTSLTLPPPHYPQEAIEAPPPLTLQLCVCVFQPLLRFCVVARRWKGEEGKGEAGNRANKREEARLGKGRQEELENPGEAMKTFVAAAARFGSGAGRGSAKEGAWARCSIVFTITGGGFVLLLVGWSVLYLCGSI
jgi:hypothetical protein